MTYHQACRFFLLFVWICFWSTLLNCSVQSLYYLAPEFLLRYFISLPLFCLTSHFIHLLFSWFILFVYLCSLIAHLTPLRQLFWNLFQAAHSSQLFINGTCASFGSFCSVIFPLIFHDPSGLVLVFVHLMKQELLPVYTDWHGRDTPLPVILVKDFG